MGAGDRRVPEDSLRGTVLAHHKTLTTNHIRQCPQHRHLKTLLGFSGFENKEVFNHS